MAVIKPEAERDSCGRGNIIGCSLMGRRQRGESAVLAAAAVIITGLFSKATGDDQPILENMYSTFNLFTSGVYRGFQIFFDFN